MRKAILIVMLATTANLLTGQTMVTLDLPNPCSSVGIENVSQKQSNGLEVTVSPNPTNGKFTMYITCNEVIELTEFKLFNTQGVCLMIEEFYSGNKKCVKLIDVVKIPIGYYLLTVKRKNEKKTVKLIIVKN